MNTQENEQDIKFNCVFCNYTCKYISQWKKHVVNKKHLNQSKSIINMNLSSTVYKCDKCDFLCNKKFVYKQHLSTHINKSQSNLDQKVTNTYECKICDYICSRRFLLDQHCNTQKHINQSNSSKLDKIYTCTQCDKSYTTSNSLWVHKKRCKPIEATPVELEDIITAHPLNGPPSTALTEHIMMFLKDSNDFKRMMVEQNEKLLEQNNRIIEFASKQATATNNQTITNNNNTNFNLNFFLNEKCKDALNITDFVNSLEIDVNDLENTAKVGFVNGITQIILNGLNEIDMYKRPMHCTDVKRETIYIKDKDRWEKENEEKTNLKKAISTISQKNMQQLVAWQHQNPDYETVGSQTRENHLYIMRNILGGGMSEYEKNKEKIIKNITKEISIEDKQFYK